MPDEEPEAAVARAVESGTDAIVVPAELLAEPEEKPGAPPPPPPESLWARVGAMDMAEKIKLALRGNKDARTILVRDTNRVIRRLVLQNPRMTDQEALALARNRNVDDELLRIIAVRRDWMRNYQVRHALATNPKTPVTIALKQLSSLGDRDLRQLAKSRNVPDAVSAQARRMVLSHGGPG
jgi:hypothetical protein